MILAGAISACVSIRSCRGTPDRAAASVYAFEGFFFFPLPRSSDSVWDPNGVEASRSYFLTVARYAGRYCIGNLPGKLLAAQDIYFALIST